MPNPARPPTEYLTLVQAADGATVFGAASIDEPEFMLEGSVAGSGTVVFDQR